MRIKVNYVVNGSPVSDQAEINDFPQLWPTYAQAGLNNVLWSAMAYNDIEVTVLTFHQTMQT